MCSKFGASLTFYVLSDTAPCCFSEASFRNIGKFHDPAAMLQALRGAIECRHPIIHNSRTKHGRSTKLGTHGESDPHLLMEGHIHFWYRMFALVPPTRGGWSLITCYTGTTYFLLVAKSKMCYAQHSTCRLVLLRTVDLNKLSLPKIQKNKERLNLILSLDRPL